jgi:adenylate cyclase
MGDQPTQRRLVAVLAADVAGYTRLMEQDTDGTVAAWQAARREVIKPMVADHSGKIVKLTGDGFLVEFLTVQDAVNCAIAMQRGLVPSSLDFRMGINLGDIVDDGEDIHGEGVNIAARLEGLADPGGICISGDVYNQVRNRIEETFEDLGDQKVKNVAEPVRVYRLTSSTEPKQIARFAPDERLQLIDTPTKDDKPVIAVLPLANMSDDADFAYFADGLAEDLIFSLSSFRWFRVLARTATFRMRDADPNPHDIRRMYGATYIVSGSVRRTGSRLRISIELVDCRSGQQLWAGQYDKALEDLFEVEDEITLQLASAIEPMLEDSEMRRTLGRPTENLAAYELLQRGYWHLYRGSQEDHDEARRCFEAAVASDSTYASALAGLAFFKYRDAHANLMNNYRQRMEDSRNTAARAVELDPQDPRALRYFAGASCFLGDQDAALDAVSRSIELCPSYASAYSGLAFVHDFKGNFSEAKPAADETIRLRPHDPGLHRCIMSKAIAHYQTGEYEHAERVTRDSLRTNSSYWMGNMMLMASLGQRGRLEDARAAAQRICAVQPGITLEIMLKKTPFADQAHSDHLADGLIRAGWRDGGAE